jgi:hypothetical protein
MMNDILVEISNHLEFYGYDIVKEEPENNTDHFTYHANHNTHFNLRFFEINESFVLFQICFLTDKQSSPDVAETINEFNKNGLLAKYYYNTNSDGLVVIYIEAVFTGDYTKKSFARFYEMFETDHKKARQSDSYKNCFIARNEPEYTVQ